MCGGNHLTDECSRFLKHPVPERCRCVRRLHLCFVCLQKEHRRGDCLRRKPGQTRNALLEWEATNQREKRQRDPRHTRQMRAKSDGRQKEGSTEQMWSPARSQGLEEEDESSPWMEEETTSVRIHLSTACINQIRLLTVCAVALDENGKKWIVNCQLDRGSERSLIRQDVADELDLKGLSNTMTVKGVNGLRVKTPDVRRMQHRVAPVSDVAHSSGKKLQLTALCISKICDDALDTLMPWPFGSDLPPGTLPDILLSLTSIHVLIRLDAYFQVLGCQERRGRKNTATAVESIFGWIICGLTAQPSMSSEETALLTQMVDDVAQSLLRFWEGGLWG
ncbi:hypothetical protein T07_12681 [Trichinella nelsoni]|uniref:Uncharacterized protein n=1 Tax=Trichinella nelsoni TaxID=6336 RepID=A0A0V0RQC2_9BILA|nr:hypothetical protein T07_12681 [Trichinella nelsoni]